VVQFPPFLEEGSGLKSQNFAGKDGKKETGVGSWILENQVGQMVKEKQTDVFSCQISVLKATGGQKHNSKGEVSQIGQGFK
jgi:hypothetical protein